jgi:uncharacterized membrane protein
MNDRIGTRKLEPRLAAVLAYLLGLVTGIIILRIERHDRFVRFHALQSILYTSAAIVLLLGLLMISLEAVAAMVAMLVWAGWVVLMLRAARGEMFQLSFIGRWAEANV